MTTLRASLLINLVKITVAALLIYWLMESGKLDFRQLAVLTTSWETTLALIAGWMFVMVGMSSLRWFCLLRGIGIFVKYWRAVTLTMIGMFFNATMPGAVGGDIIKAVYVIRGEQLPNKTGAMLTILLDRVVGLMGLFLLGGIAVAMRWDFFMSHHALIPLGLIIAAVNLVTILFFGILFAFKEKGDVVVEKILRVRFYGVSILRKIYETMRLYRERPWALVAALMISLFNQSLLMLFFMWVTTLLNGSCVDILTYASIYPVGILVTALPLAPGGMGVGHVAFDNFYRLVGMPNGANVFNIYVLGSLVLNLTGALPYLLIRKREPVKASDFAQ